MPAPTVRVERTDDDVTILTIDRPEVHNCIDGATADGITAAIEAFAEDPDSRVLLVTGAGGRAFCAGADLRDVDGLMRRPDARRTGWLGFSWLDPGKPAIAAIEGYCVGGGIELACWCDFRVAGAGAVFAALNRRVGVPWVDGGTQRLARSVGLGNALYLMESGERVDATRAKEMGLVQEVVPEGTSLDRALELARRIAAYPQQSLLADRRAALATFGLPLEDGLALEAEVGGETAATAELADAVRGFLDRPRDDAR
jgi:enoyl-CoA hydratase